MNIFKILANGHGTVNENNISAFLGYLLDPNENHSLDYKFLIRFLGNILEENEKYEFKIFFEQEFREGKNTKKEVVDIVIVCYQTNISNKKKTSVKDFIQNKKKIEKIILIENKINSGSKNIGQLKRQYNSTIDELKKIEKNIDNIDTHSIYITPDNSNFVAEFENFKNEINSNATHIFWKQNDKNPTEEKTSIKEILENILLLENQAKIDPINEYTKHTLKSFIQFIKTDFKSEKEAKEDRVNDGSYSQRFSDLNKSSKIEEKLIKLKKELIEITPTLNDYIVQVSITPRNPEINIFIDDIILSIYAGYEARNRVTLIIRANNKFKETTKKSLLRIEKKLGVQIKKPKSKYSSYCFTEYMKKENLLTEVNNISEVIIRSINDIKS